MFAKHIKNESFGHHVRNFSGCGAEPHALGVKDMSMIADFIAKSSIVNLAPRAKITPILLKRLRLHLKRRVPAILAILLQLFLRRLHR